MNKRKTKAGDEDTEGCCGALLESIVSPELFRALCDPQRLAIICRLLEVGGPKTVSEIAASCPVDLSVVSRHLKILRQAGAVACRKVGKEVRCELAVPFLVGTLRDLASAIEHAAERRSVRSDRRSESRRKR